MINLFLFGCLPFFIIILLLVMGYAYNKWVGIVLALLIIGSVLFTFLIWWLIAEIKRLRLTTDNSGRIPSKCRCCNALTSLGKEYSFFYGTGYSTISMNVTTTKRTLHGQKSYFICDNCIAISESKSLIRRITTLYILFAICLSSILLVSYNLVNPYNDIFNIVAVMSGGLFGILFIVLTQDIFNFEERGIDLAISAWLKENNYPYTNAWPTWDGRRPS